MNANYLERFERETKREVTKTKKIIDTLRGMILNNNYIYIESKITIFKATERPVRTYANETRAETKVTKQKWQSRNESVPINPWDDIREIDTGT